MKPVEECDVEDRAALIEFRRKYEEWISWFWSDEYHALERQLVRMMHFDMAYRVLIEARRGPDGSTPVAAMNGLLASFMDQCYVETQVLAIGRLTDRGKDVVSIRRLLDDVRANCHLLTRENYVAYDGLPYEPRIGGSGLLSPESDEAKNVRSWARHQKFDQLSGVSPERRSRSDCVRCQFFKTIESYLDEVDEDGLRKLRNKFIAHAANPSSRGSQRYAGPSAEILEKVAKAHRLILRAFVTTSDLLRSEKVSLIVNPPPGFLNSLDKPYSSVSIADLRGRWEELNRERERIGPHSKIDGSGRI
jgi:hypothetical protein